MPEVQQRSAAGWRELAFIGLDKARLQRATAPDNRGQIGAANRKDRAFQPDEQLRVAE
jgi:hypothetical protein